ncbi:UDP-glucose 6-dehydrogenase, partial [bacterium]|nr:UDP-glucose 6-dehydrogenase [bacterium]
YCSDPYDAAEGADALILMTEWEEFLKMDLQRIYKLLNYPIFIDGRNSFEPSEMSLIGFEYHCVGS